MTTDVRASLEALESLAAEPSTSSAGPLDTLLEKHFAAARERIAGGEDVAAVVAELQKSVTRAKKDVERGLKAWYAALGTLGKSVDKSFPPNLAAVSAAYDDPPLFVQPDAKAALDRAVLKSLGRRGVWDAVDAMQEETGLRFEDDTRHSSEELVRILAAMAAGDVSTALAWCDTHAAFLAAPPHPSALPYHLHRAVFLSLAPADALAYARTHLFAYVATQPVLPLITSCLYAGAHAAASPYDAPPAALAAMFRAEYCRRHGLAKEEPLEVAVDLGSRGGALNVVEKARKVMGDRLGNVRTWQELPIEVPLPADRRYHSVFVCPVSKEQATESNPPKMLSCGHVIAQESFNRLLKGGRRTVKCPYCPVETSQQAAQRLYL